MDEGSTDNTQEVLLHFEDPRIRVIRVALNRGFDAIRDEWFTLLDSDDEMVPQALSTMLEIPVRVDPRINDITCNCIDTSTGSFSGHGLKQDQWLDFKTLVSQLSGESTGVSRRRHY